MFSFLEHIVIYLGNILPLEFFSFFASFLEEVIPPIPSPSVMLLTGSSAEVQGYVIYGLFFLALLGGLGKTFGASVVYYVVDKAEDFLSGKWGKFLGVNHKQIESFGARLKGGMKDYFIMIILRTLPIIPSSLISVGGGLLKINFKLFLVSTFVGSVFRGFIYLYTGYIGTNIALSFVRKTTTVEAVFEALAIIFIILFLGYLYYKRNKAKS